LSFNIKHYKFTKRFTWNVNKVRKVILLYINGEVIPVVII